MSMKSYRDLQVWQKSINLVDSIYKLTQNFPGEELYGLTSQLRRAAISIPSNIAEGSSRRSTKEFIRFINIAYGSLSEIETQIIIAERLEFIDNKNCEEQLAKTAEIGRMLNGLLSSLNQRINNPKVTELRTPNSDNFEDA